MAIIQRWLILFSLNQAHMNGQIPVFNTVKQMTKIALKIQNKTVNAFRLTIVITQDHGQNTDFVKSLCYGRPYSLLYNEHGSSCFTYCFLMRLEHGKAK